jgi:hypothetical protein
VQAKNSDQRLFNRLYEIQTLTKNVHSEFCSSWIAKLAAGQPMTEKEFYLFKVSDCGVCSAKGFGLLPVGDYEIFLNCCYKGV